MANNNQETILTIFRDVSGGNTSSGSTQTSALSDLTSQLVETSRQIAESGGAQAEAIGANTKAVESAQKTGSTEPTSGGVSAGAILSTVFKSGLGLIPLVSGLLGLFGGGSDPEPPPLVRYALPQSLNVTAARWDGVTADADYDQFGALRPVLPSTASNAAANPTTGGSQAIEGSSSPGPTSAPVINVQVQAMDSQSFLDHSQEIARAVRDAMLNLNSINDVINDL